MLKISKKILSIFMVVIMILTATPLSGFVGLELPGFDWIVKASSQTIATSGQCGDNIYWNYETETSTLIISGSGAMWDFEEVSVPWEDWKGQINSILIEEGITETGYRSFRNCTALEFISLPKTLTYIDEYSFTDCISLKAVCFSDKIS